MKDLGSRRIDHPSPGYGQVPTVGGLLVSFRPLSDRGGVGGQSPGLSLQHELLKREMNQQLVQYHVPAQMQATVPQTRIHEDLRFRGPGGSEAAGVSRGANSEISDPTAPKISEDTSMREEIPVAELNVLLKFLQTLGDLPKIDLGEPASRGERLAVWRTAGEAQLRTTRKVVMEWWKWSYAGAEIYYNHWLKLPLLQRNQKKITEDMPIRFQTVEDWFFPRFLLCPYEIEGRCNSGADLWCQLPCDGCSLQTHDAHATKRCRGARCIGEAADQSQSMQGSSGGASRIKALVHQRKKSSRHWYDVTKLGAALSRCEKHLLWGFRD